MSEIEFWLRMVNDQKEFVSIHQVYPMLSHCIPMFPTFLASGLVQSSCQSNPYNNKTWAARQHASLDMLGNVW